MRKRQRTWALGLTVARRANAVSCRTSGIETVPNQEKGSRRSAREGERRNQPHARADNSAQSRWHDGARDSSPFHHHRPGVAVVPVLAENHARCDRRSGTSLVPCTTPASGSRHDRAVQHLPSVRSLATFDALAGAFTRTGIVGSPGRRSSADRVAASDVEAASREALIRVSGKRRTDCTCGQPCPAAHGKGVVQSLTRARSDDTIENTENYRLHPS